MDCKGYYARFVVRFFASFLPQLSSGFGSSLPLWGSGEQKQTLLSLQSNSRHPQPYVDLVMMPVIGTAWLIGEDMLDRYLLRPLKTSIDSHAGRMFVRSFFNPARSFANLMRGRWFRHRDDRPGVSHY